MAVSRCPLCGCESLEERRGEFRMEPPANTPGGALVVSNAEWRFCVNCRESFLPGSLSKALEREQRRRLSVAVPVSSCP